MLHDQLVPFTKNGTSLGGSGAAVERLLGDFCCGDCFLKVGEITVGYFTKNCAS
jgi:hypothetical protein